MKDCIVPDVFFSEIDLNRKENVEFLCSNVFPNFAAIIEKYQPKTYLEIGTQYGCSLAVALGVGCIEKAFAIDLPSDRPSVEYGGLPGAFSKAKVDINSLFPGVTTFIELDSQRVERLPFPDNIDLAYIDGDHSLAGCWHDMDLAFGNMSAHGVLVVDDVDHHPYLRGCCEDWAARHDVAPIYWPDSMNRGRMVIEL